MAARGRYVEILNRHHSRTHANGCVLEHIAVAEAALGHPLPPKVEVHHVNEIKSDNRPTNLVICEDAAYHRLLHVRARVLRAGGRPSADKICSTCQQVKPRTDFGASRGQTDGLDFRCRACRRKPGAWAACRRGHPWTPESTYVRPDTGTKMCRICTGHKARSA